MTTNARTQSSDAAHWYDKDGKPCHWVDRASGDGTRPTTLADARKLGLIPSVTTKLKVIDRPGLTAWKQEQAVLATLTAPRKEGELLDDFVKRVLQLEEQQSQEAKEAGNLGTEIHDAIQRAVAGKAYPQHLERYVIPVLMELAKFGRCVASEKVIVGLDYSYAGRLDWLGEKRDELTLVDFKSSKKLPTKGSWPEHRIQLAAYAHGLGNTGGKRIVRTANIYISTTEPGKCAVFEDNDWQETYVQGWMPVSHLWNYLNNWTPPTA